MDQSAQCPQHPENPAVGVCARCGVFFCERERRVVDGKEYCERCASLPEIDYLEAFRLRYWGKRDAWAWLVGLGGVFNGLAAISLAVAASSTWQPAAILYSLVSLGASTVAIGFWLGRRWARPGLLVVPLALAAFNTVTTGLAAGLVTLLPFLMALAVYHDTRNQLFFKVPIPRKKLHKAWDLYANNVLARVGFQTSLAGLLIVPIAPAALLISIVALMRVNPLARPPIGKKGQAIAGIVLGGVGTLLFGALVVALLRDLVAAGSP